MFAKVADWFKPIPDAKPLTDEQEIKRLYRSWRIKMFFSMYFGYALFYFTRKNLDIIKPAMMDAGVLTKGEFAIVGVVAYFTYGVGKFVSGVFADRSRISSFMATGLIVSSLSNISFAFL
ncbi:MAG: thiamine biosynthesis protein ThiF, partial [Elusimicrobiaceae bacterium]|nr:thiamine biosynthesis protein ThiF [Elusimicrobiaceae bacterium]